MRFREESIAVALRVGSTSTAYRVAPGPSPTGGSEPEVDNEGMNETQPHNLERERWRTLPTPPSNELIEMVGDGPSSADFDPAAPMAQQG